MIAMPNAMDSAAKMKRGAITRSNTIVGNTITPYVSSGVNQLSFARAFLENFLGTAIASIQHSRTGLIFLGQFGEARRTLPGQ
jgi:hypothetical protein